MDTNFQRDCYRYQLLQRVRYLFRAKRGKVHAHMKGTDRVIVMTGPAPDNLTCCVWYPSEGRVRDAEINELKDATLWLLGEVAI